VICPVSRSFSRISLIRSVTDSFSELIMHHSSRSGRRRSAGGVHQLDDPTPRSLPPPTPPAADRDRIPFEDVPASAMAGRQVKRRLFEGLVFQQLPHQVLSRVFPASSSPAPPSGVSSGRSILDLSGGAWMPARDNSPARSRFSVSSIPGFPDTAG
jgi:hypothetical protein